MSAPNRTSSLTTCVLPLKAARCRAVLAFSSSSWTISRFLRISSCTVFNLPFSAARWSGVCSSSFFWSMIAPLSSRICEENTTPYKYCKLQMGKSGLWNVKKAYFIRNRRRFGNPDYPMSLLEITLEIFLQQFYPDSAKIWIKPTLYELKFTVEFWLDNGHQWTLASCFFSLRHSGHFCWEILVTETFSVICLTVVLKLAVTVFISRYFQTFWPKWLNFLRSFQNHSGLWPNKTACKSCWAMAFSFWNSSRFFWILDMFLKKFWKPPFVLLKPSQIVACSFKNVLMPLWSIEIAGFVTSRCSPPCTPC